MLDPQMTVDFITTVGFPIAVTTYLLIERNTTVKELTKAINRLSDLIKDRVK